MRFERPRIHFTDNHKFEGSHATFTAYRTQFESAALSLAPQIQAPVSPKDALNSPQTNEPRPTGYDAYDRSFSDEGGIRLEYRDVERTLPIILGKLCLGIIALIATYRLGAAYSPIHGYWWNVLAYTACCGVYACILIRDTHVQRTIEIRPDCMILEGTEVFWKANMPIGWPGFQPNAKGHFVFAGVYGTRWIEFLTVRRLDDNDRAAEVFAEQVTAAMKSQWELPSKGV